MISLQQRGWAFGNIACLSDIPRMNSLLERSGKQDFTLTAFDRNKEGSLMRSTASSLRDCLSDLQWHCSIPIGKFFDLLGWPTPNSADQPLELPSLRNLTITSTSSAKQSDKVSFLGVEFPRLLSLTLDDVYITSLRVAAINNVRHVSLHNVTMDHLAFKIYLEHCVNLTELKINNFLIATDSVFYATPLNVQSLEILYLIPVQFEAVHLIFGSYYFPSLQGLYLDVKACIYEHPSQSYPNPNYPDLYDDPMNVNVHLHNVVSGFSVSRQLFIALTHRHPCNTSVS